MKKEELDRMMKENPEKVLEILSDIQKVPYQLIERSVDYEYQFPTGEMPVIWGQIFILDFGFGIW